MAEEEKKLHKSERGKGRGSGEKKEERGSNIKKTRMDLWFLFF